MAELKDFTVQDLDVFLEKLGVDINLIKEDFERKFPIASKIIEIEDYRPVGQREQALTLYFGYKVGYLDQVYNDRFARKVT